MRRSRRQESRQIWARAQEAKLEVKVQAQGGRGRREDVSHAEAHIIRQIVQRTKVQEEVLIHSGPWLL